MVNRFLLQIPFLLALTGMLGACTTDAVNRDQMVNLDKVALKSEITLSDLDSALMQDRGNAVLYAKRALLFLDRGETEKALADINRALDLNDNKGEYYFRKALILRQAGKIPAAQEAAAEAENQGFKETAVYVLQSELLIRLRNYPAALEKVNIALEEAPDHEYALFYRGIVRAASGDTASALINFRKAIRRSPNFLDAYLQLASIHNAKKDYVRAKPYLVEAERLRQDNAFLWLQKGIRYSGLQQTDSALFCLQKAVERHPGFIQAHYQLGLLYYKQQNFPALVKHLEKVKAVTDTLPRMQQYLAEGYEKTGQYQAALQEYQKVLRRQPNDVRAGWGIRRSNWALYKMWRDSLRQKGLETPTILDSVKTNTF